MSWMVKIFGMALERLRAFLLGRTFFRICGGLVLAQLSLRSLHLLYRYQGRLLESMGSIGQRVTNQENMAVAARNCTTRSGWILVPQNSGWICKGFPVNQFCETVGGYHHFFLLRCASQEWDFYRVYLSWISGLVSPRIPWMWLYPMIPPWNRPSN